jgi:hypothetical protein
MSLLIQISGEDYLPLRAVPVVTGGLLNAPTIADLIYDPETYCDSQYGEILSASEYAPLAGLTPVHHERFLARRQLQAAATPLLDALMLPAGMVVRLKATREKFDLIQDQIIPRRQNDLWPTSPVWRIAPALCRADIEMLWAGLPLPRSNSAATLRATILVAMEQIERAMTSQGLQFDRDRMVGTRSEWATLIWLLEPSTCRAQATMNDHFEALGFRWCRGARAAGIDPVRVAMGLPTRSFRS